MPSGIKLARRRLATAKMLIEFCRLAASIYLKRAKNFGTAADELILFLAVMVGQIEGRPMTAAKLATYAGIPRASAIRKLEAMESDGVVKQLQNGAYKATESIMNSPDAVRMSEHFEKLLMDRSSKVSIPDTAEVASVNANNLARDRRKKNEKL